MPKQKKTALGALGQASNINERLRKKNKKLEDDITNQRDTINAMAEKIKQLEQDVKDAKIAHRYGNY